MARCYMQQLCMTCQCMNSAETIIGQRICTILPIKQTPLDKTCLLHFFFPFSYQMAAQLATINTTYTYKPQFSQVSLVGYMNQKKKNYTGLSTRVILLHAFLLSNISSLKSFAFITFYITSTHAFFFLDHPFVLLMAPH